MAPLVQKVAIDVDAVGFRQVLGDQLADGGQIGLFLGAMVLDVAQGVPLAGIGIVAHEAGRAQSGVAVGWSERLGGSFRAGACGICGILTRDGAAGVIAFTCAMGPLIRPLHTRRRSFWLPS